MTSLELILAANDLVQRSVGEVPTDLERRWDLTCIAVLEGWGDPAVNVAGDSSFAVWSAFAGNTDQLGLLGIDDKLGAGLVLQKARARFPGEPRFRLAEVEANEATTTRCDFRFCFDEETPAVLDDLRRRAALPARQDSSSGSLEAAMNVRETAVRNLATFAHLPEVAAEFARLANDDRLRAEADVHIGYSAIRVARYDAALAPLATAAALPTDQHVAYLAEYLTGRALEGQGRRNEAIDAYRRALAIVPNARSATVLLAAQQLLSASGADRADAYQLLDPQPATVTPHDPWADYWRGDARLYEAYLAQLREALR